MPNKRKSSGYFFPIGIFFVLFSIPSLSAYNRESVGTSGAQFLKLPVSARAIAMGEAYSAVSDGSDSIYWNPAALGRVEGKAFSFMHAFYLESISYDYTSYAHRMGSVGTMGLGVQYLSGSSIDRTDELGSTLGTFKPYDLAISVGWARKFMDLPGDRRLLLGVSGKFIQSRIVRTAASGAVDLGLSVNLSEKSWLGLAVQNIGPSIKFNEKGDNLPLNVKLGSSYNLFQSLLLAMDINAPRDNDLNVSLGAEYRKPIASESFFMPRIGYNSRTTSDIDRGLSSISLGSGFEWRNYGIDFAWVPFGNLGHTYRLGLSAKF